MNRKNTMYTVIGLLMTGVLTAQTQTNWGDHAGSYDLNAVRDRLSQVGLRTFKSEIPAIDFSAERLDESAVSLKEFAGNLVFLNFWATWCPPCRDEMPSMEKVHRELKELPFVILAVNVQEPPDTVRSFVDEFGYTFPVLLDESGRVASEYGVRGIPATYIIGPDGIILAQLVGTRYWDEPEILNAFRDILEEF